MKTSKSLFKSLFLTIFFVAGATLFVKAAKRQFYEIKIYTISSTEQEKTIDAFLKEAYLPAMHRLGIKSVGVFKPRSTTDDVGKKIYVFTPLKSQSQILKINSKLDKDAVYQMAGKDYIDAKFDNKPYDRIETIILLAFAEMPQMKTPMLNGNRSERIYELRSYESPTEKYHDKKVEMFNVGGEVTIFKNLNFNAVFYGKVITGSHMPNLMYLTTFENQKDRDTHWKAFSDSPDWGKLKVDTQYANTVSKNTQFFLYPTDYSDF